LGSLDQAASDADDGAAERGRGVGCMQLDAAGRIG